MYRTRTIIVTILILFNCVLVLSRKLSQNGKSINYDKLIPGTKVYFYKPPSALEVEIETRGRKAKHLHNI